MRKFLTGTRGFFIAGLAAMMLLDASVSAATFTVSNTNDDLNPGSLRRAITDALAGGVGPHDIQAGGVTGTISLLSQLPIITNSNITIHGPNSGTLTVTRGTGTFRIFTVSNSGGAAVLTLNRMTITNGVGTVDSNFVNPDGGGIGVVNATVNLNFCTITGCTSTSDGGGIAIEGTTASTVNVNFCTLSGNSANRGGAISGLMPSGTATLTVQNSTFSGNTASVSAGGVNLTRTDGVFSNCTFSGNVVSIGNGGGLMVGSSGTLTMLNCTVKNNSVAQTGTFGGGIRSLSTGPVTLINTLVVGNLSGTGNTPDDTSWSANTAKTAKNSVIGADGGFGFASSTASQVGTPGSPKVVNLGPLANNGGVTQTHALLATAPELAINMGSNSDASRLAFDQRGVGYNRFNGAVDIGAFETGVASPSFTVVAPLGTAAQINNSATLPFMVPPGTNRVLVVAASTASTTGVPDISGVTFNGVAMTLSVKKSDTSAAADSLWYLAQGTATTETSANIVVTVSGTGAIVTSVGGIAFQNVDQTTPMNNPLSENNPGIANAPGNLSVTSTPGDVVIDLFDIYDSSDVGTQTPGAGQAVVHNVDAPSSAIHGFYQTSIKPGAASTAMTWTSNGSAMIHVAANIKQFSAGSPPTVTTPTQSSVTTTTAVLGGNVTSAGSAPLTAVGVVYALTATNANPQLAGTGVTSQTGAAATGIFTLNVSALSPGSGYSFAAYATNSVGTTYSPVSTFTTTAPDLIVAMTHAGNFTQGQTGAQYTITVTNSGTASTSGTVTATLTLPAGLTATALSGTGWTPAGNFLSATRSDALGASSSYPALTLTVSVAANATSPLTPSVTVSGGGEVNAANDTSSDPTTILVPAPTATTTAATSVINTGATLNGSVNANGASSTVTFQYGLTTGYGSTVTAAQSPVTGSSASAVSGAITALTPNTLYHYRVVATNTGGTTNGADLTFTTLPNAPTVTSSAATSITQTSATLNGTANANGVSSAVSFEYGLTTAYGSTATAAQSPVTGSSATSVTAAISGLTPNTLYHFRVDGTNTGGTSNSTDLTFTTLPNAPTVTTNAASSTTQTDSTLNGSVNANGVSSTVSFEYGLTTAYGSTITATQSPVTGSSATAVTGAVTGLTPNTLYHYRVVGTNTGGTNNGADSTFTTLPNAPTVTPSAATSVTQTTAMVNGSANANGVSSTVSFEYGLTTAYGSTATAAQSPVTGSTATPVTAAIGGLTANTLYHFRVDGTNTGGTSNSTDLTFTTLPNAPTVTVNAASAITNTSATLNGSVNANGVSSTVTFEYGLTAAYGSTATASPSPVTGSSATAVSAAISALVPNTLYHFRVDSTNTGGTSNSSDQTFTTLPNVPAVTTTAATAITSTAATLNGSVNANGVSSTVTFDYGTTGAYGSTITATQSPVTGSSAVAVSASPSGLTPNTLYHFRVNSTNTGGSSNGSDLTFTTLPNAPTVTATTATSITQTGATLNGSVNANGVSTTVTFEYGTTTAYGSTLTATQSPVSGSSATAVSSSATGLTPNTLYHFRVGSTNTGGTTNSADLTFMTLPVAPVVTTNAATGISGSGATLNGTVNANGASTTVTFEYGLTASYGSTVTATQSPVSGSSPVPVSAPITGLSAGTLYHFRVNASNTGGLTNGLDQIFVSNTAPIISGTVANQPATDKSNISPFVGVTISDSDVPAQTLSVSVTVDTAAKGSFTLLNGFANAGGGVYTFSGTAAAATTALRGMVFNPTENRVKPGLTETITFTISANDGIAPAVTDSTTSVVSTSINDAPNLSSDPTGTPGSTTVNQPIQFSVAATDPDADALTYIWNFKDGTSSTMQNPVHTFSAPGTYNVSVTVSDPNGGSTFGTVSIVVNAGVLGEGDSDDDGFSDEIENALGSNPYNANSRPVDLPSPLASAPLTNANLRVKLDFTKNNHDSILLTAHLPVNGVFPVNQVLIVDVGGVVKSFVLDAAGHAKLNAHDRLTLHVGRVRAQASPLFRNFQMKLSAGSFAAALTDEQLTTEAATNAPRTVNVAVVFLNTVLKASIPQLYTSVRSTGKTTTPK